MGEKTIPGKETNKCKGPGVGRSRRLLEAERRPVWPEQRGRDEGQGQAETKAHSRPCSVFEPDLKDKGKFIQGF